MHGLVYLMCDLIVLVGAIVIYAWTVHCQFKGCDRATWSRPDITPDWCECVSRCEFKKREEG